MQIHLDALGGMAGDMFVGALLDAFPDHLDGVLASVAAATVAIPVTCRLEAHNDGILQGRRFIVSIDDAVAEPGLSLVGVKHDHHHDSNAGPHHRQHGAVCHAHRHWSDIRTALVAANLHDDVRHHALAIFGHLAQAEAKVHGRPVDEVAFHEVGAWDSIADIVAAAYLITTLNVSQWSVAPLPLGSGRVKTAHGLLPVPAPATVLLLEGLTTIDDGIGGERVTPTGAAILRHLCFGDRPPPIPRVIARSGIGFGAKTMPGISNCLRVLAFEEAHREPSAEHRELAIIEFEVDDQSAEDLAMGLERLRDHSDIFDVIQMPVFGKKGRMMTHVRVLARATSVEVVVSACFRETTTIGLRHHVVSGASLSRHMTTVEIEGRSIRVKTVDRPDGRTAKADADDVLKHETHAARAGLRREAERLALLQGHGP